MASAGALALQCWLSPAFPVGAYAYSHGLEWAVEAGDVRDAGTLRAWVHDLIEDGIGRHDTILLACAHRAAEMEADRGLAGINDLALALSPGAELRLETAQQGRSFLDAVAETWPHPRLTAFRERFLEVAYPVAVAMASAAHGVGRTETSGAYLVAMAQNLISAGIRLAPIGQTAGQAVLAGLLPDLLRLAREVDGLGLDDLGTSTIRSDLGALRHETQYTRLFRS